MTTKQHIKTVDEIRRGSRFSEPDHLLDEVSEAREAIKERLQELHRAAGPDALSASAQREWDSLHELDARHDAYERELYAEVSAEQERRLRRVQESRAKWDSLHVAPIEPDRSTLPRSSARDTAMRTLDDAMRSHDLEAHSAEKVETLLTRGTESSRTLAARWAIAAGDAAYRGAFAKILSDPTRGHLLWTSDEQRAYQAVAEVQSEMRAMSLTDNAGGYMVPLTLDPSIILTSAGSINPLRRVSRVVQTMTDTWQGVSSAGVTAEWKTEGAEAADATPTLAGPSIPVYLGDAFVPYSYEVGQDAREFLSELTTLLLDGADQLMATAYTTGTGSGQPTGIIKALDGGSSEVAPDTAEVFATSDVFGLIEAVPPRFRANATWQANLSIANLIRQFESGNGARYFPEIESGKLIGRDFNENSNMDGTWDTAATADNFILLAGDFSNFVIADRVGTTLEPIQNLFGANGRPTGQRGAMLWFRTGSDSVNDNAFRVLNLATTA